ncbi:MAG: efflux RND transporter periplasmic adaptor subunit [Chlamydiales bacterium]
MRTWTHSFAAFGLIFLFTGCEKKIEKKERTFPVEVGEVIQKDVPYFLKGVGQLFPSLDCQIKAQVGGILINVLFEDGQLVEEGDLLMTIDPSIYEADLEEAKAQLAEDQAKLRYALEFAESYGKVVGQEYVSRLDYEQGIQNVDVYKAAVEYDLAAVKKAEINLGYTQIRAPFKGYIGDSLYDPGNLIEVSYDENLVTLNQVIPIVVGFAIPSQYVHEIRQRQKESPLYLEAELPSDPSHPLQGVLFFIDNTVNNETGMIYLKGIIPNEDERGWPGQFARVYLRLKTLKDAILIPKQALVIGADSNFVFILDEESMTVSMRTIGKGIEYQDCLVAEWGVKPNEKIIVDGQLNLFDGAKVYIPKSSEEPS